jgi:hypothetical protein
MELLFRTIFKELNTFNQDKLPFSKESLLESIKKNFREGMSLDNYGKVWDIKFILPKEGFDLEHNFDREFNLYFSLQNIYPFFIGEEINYPENFNTSCYQYKTRFLNYIKERDTIDFNPEEIDLKNSIIREITKKECSEVIEKYEWLGKMSGFSKYHFGIFFKIKDKEYLGGVLAFQDDYTQNTGVWDKYEFKGKIILLSRGVCKWWTPKNCASYFISKTYDWFNRNTEYRIFTATTDSSAGEEGIIYSALNWKGIEMNKKNKKRMSFFINGKEYSSRYIRKKYGTMKKGVLQELFPDIKFIVNPRKKRYFYFIGKEKKYNEKKFLIMHKDI